MYANDFARIDAMMRQKGVFTDTAFGTREALSGADLPFDL